MRSLEWTDITQPDDTCAYTHCRAATVFGNFTLAWKGWKPSGQEGFVFTETPWDTASTSGWYDGWNTLDAAKVAAQEAWRKRISAALAD
jgi:hypothetical protein